MVSSVNSHTNATSKRRLLWAIDLKFPLNSTPGRWIVVIVLQAHSLLYHPTLGLSVRKKKKNQADPTHVMNRGHLHGQGGGVQGNLAHKKAPAPPGPPRTLGIGLR